MTTPSPSTPDAAVTLSDAERAAIAVSLYGPDHGITDHEGPLNAAVERIVAARLAARERADEWPCDDFQAPLTCFTTPKPKTLTCEGCRAAFPRGSEAREAFAARERADADQHVVHVTAAPVAEDVVWCDECEEWVSSGAPEGGERADADQLAAVKALLDDATAQDWMRSDTGAGYVLRQIAAALTDTPAQEES